MNGWKADNDNTYRSSLGATGILKLMFTQKKKKLFSTKTRTLLAKKRRRKK